MEIGIENTTIINEKLHQQLRINVSYNTRKRLKRKE